jgi:hypothetical protein
VALTALKAFIERHDATPGVPALEYAQGRGGGGGRASGWPGQPGTRWPYECKHATATLAEVVQLR